MRSIVFCLALALLLGSIVGIASAACPCTVRGKLVITEENCDETTLELWVYNDYLEQYVLRDSEVVEDGEYFALYSSGCGYQTQCRLKCRGVWVTDAFWTENGCDVTEYVGTVIVEDGCEGGTPMEP